MAFDSSVDPSRPESAQVAALVARAEFHLAQRQFEPGGQDVRAALATARKLQGGRPYSARTEIALLVESQVLAGLGQPEAAQSDYKSALAHLSNTVDDEQPLLVAVRAQLQAR